MQLRITPGFGNQSGTIEFAVKWVDYVRRRQRDPG